MEYIYFFITLVLNIATAYVFFTLGRTGQMPRMPKVVKKTEERKSNFVDNDLEDIRDVDPKLILDSFMESLKREKGTPVRSSDSSVAKDFEDLIN
jgi:hypothetical protein